MHPLRILVYGLATICVFQNAHAILAGGEFDLPSDSPSNRLDTEGIYSFVGSLEIASGGCNY